jgi:hypothetical protein
MTLIANPPASSIGLVNFHAMPQNLLIIMHYEEAVWMMRGNKKPTLQIPTG